MYTNKSTSRVFSVLFVAVSLLALIFSAVGVTPARADSLNGRQYTLAATAITPLDGAWSGTTNQARPMSFSVSSSGTHWSTFVLDIYVAACGVTITVLPPASGTITSGQFNGQLISSGTFSFAGQFNSSTTASGTYTFTNWDIYGCGVLNTSGTWTASKPLPIPGNFTKSSPTNGAIDQSVSPALSWGVSSNAVSYEYCIDTISDVNCDTSWVSTGANPSANLSGLVSSTTYYWQVHAINGSGTTEADSGTWNSFTTSATFSVCASVTQIPVAECSALIALYNGTNGASWTTKTGWLQANTPCSWYGVECAAGTNVTGLDLTGNHLSGSIPPELESLPNLTRLYLGNNQLTGSIPPEFGSLTKLTDMYLYSNQISGVIPTQLGSMTSLTYLNLGGNQLSGSIPTQMSNLKSLGELYLYNNQLSGSIPTQLGSLPQLYLLDLSSNLLSGSIPLELGNLSSQLLQLNLSGNQLSGTIPSQLGSLTNLTDLNLEGNQLSGSIPPQLGNLINLRNLYLDINQLTGSIPTQLGNLTNLYELNLYNNKLSGVIPTQLGNLTQLNNLFLGKNQLTGSVPMQLGNLTQLYNLYLDNTQLVGEIPASFTNLANLTSLTLSCGLTSTNSTVINFINGILGVGWDIACPPVTINLKSAGLQDGWILESGENTSVGLTLNTSATTFALGDNAAKKQYRGVLSFATGAALPDTAVITGIIFKARKQGTVGSGNPVTAFKGIIVDIKNGFFGTLPGLQVSDFQVGANKSFGPFTPTLSGSGWYSINLTGGKDYINKLVGNGGLTQIRLRFKLDDNNNAVANTLGLFSGNTVTVTDRPQLIIQYYLP